MLEYELNGKIYTEADLIKMAGGKDKLPAYIKSKGFKPASKKTKQPAKLDERFGEDVYKKTFGFENPAKDQFSEINKTKKKKPVAKKWNEVVTWEDLKAEETTVAENLQKRVARFGLTPEEKVFGVNRITLRGDKKQQLEHVVDPSGISTGMYDLPEVVVGADASKEELIASAKILNDYIGKYGNKDYIQKVKKENPNLVRDAEQKIQAPTRPWETKVKEYNEDLINEFKNKEESIKSRLRANSGYMSASQRKYIDAVKPTKKDFDSPEKYNLYEYWKKTGQIPLPSEVKLEKFIKEKNNNYRDSKSAELMSDAPQEQRTMLLALESEREDKAIEGKVKLSVESDELDKAGKALSEKIAKFQKTPPTKQEYDEIQKEYLALQNRSNAYNKEALTLNRDFNNIKAVSEAASKDYSRLNQTGTFLKQTGLALAGAAEDIRISTKAFELALAQSVANGDSFGETYTRNKSILKETLLDPIYGEQKAASKELESYQRDLQIKDIKSMKDLGRWGAGILTQMPSSMAMAVTGEAALPLFFLSGYGSKQYEIASLQESALSRLQYNADQINKGLVAAEDMADVQKQIASDKKTLNISEGTKLTSQVLAGAAEVLLEKYGTLGIIKQTDNILRAIPPQEIKRQLKVIGKEMGKSAGVESWTEGLTQLANNFGDIHLLGQDKNYFDGVPDAMAGGAFMGPGFSAMGGAGTISNNITKSVISELATKEEFKARNKKLDEIKKLTGLDDITGLTKRELNKLKLQPPIKKAVEDLIDQMDGDDLRILDRLGKDFSMEDAKKVGDFNQKLRKITRDWNEASKTVGIDDAQLRSLKEYYQKQYNEVFAAREAMLTDKQLTGKNKKENAQKRITFEATAGYNLYKRRLTRKTYLEKLAGFDKLSSEEKQRYNDLALLELNQDATMDQLSNKEVDSKARELYAGEEIGKQLDRDIQAANDFSTELGLNIKIETINSEKELLEKYGKFIDEEELKDFKNGKTNGFNIDDNTLVVYKPNAIKNGHTSTGSHEVLHTVLSKAFQGNQEEANKNGIKLLEYLKTAQPSLYAAVEERMKAYKPEYKAYGEEVFNALSDSFSDGKIPNDDVFTQISKVVNKITKGAFGTSSTYDIKNISTDSGKALFDTIKAYSQKAGAKRTKSGQNIRFINSDTEDKAAEETPATGFKASKAKVAEVQKKIDNLEDQLDKGEIDYEDYESRLEIFEADLAKAKLMPEEAPKPTIKKEVTEEEADKEIIKNERGSISSDKVQRIYEEKGVNGAQEIIDLFKPITKKLVNKRMDAPGFDRELLTSEIETGDGGLFYLIRSYKPETGVPLAAYINKQLPLRAIAASRRVLDKDFSKDVTEEKGLIAEETVSEAKEKPKYKNALESNVFSPEILKTATNKIVTIVRTLKNRIDAPVTLNRTVTPLISEIRDEVGKQLDIDIKTMLGGKKDGVLRKELLRNKRYILENMTTTWLMGKDGQGGIPQAIQKQIDGKWVSYPDWVGQKIDREKTTTDQAGRTSGAELVRRLPNVNNNVSNEDFLAQIIGPDGNPIRGRKESVSKAMAEEGAFDIINDDLAKEGPIFEALVTNQERLGYEVTNAFAVEIARQSERGNIKFSKTGIRAIDNISNEFNDFYKNLNYTNRASVFNYLNSKDVKVIDNDIKNKLEDILERWKTAYVNNSKELLSKLIAKKNKELKDKYPKVEDFDEYFSKKLEIAGTSKTMALGLTPKGLDFAKNNQEKINEINNFIISDLEKDLNNDELSDLEKTNKVNTFLRTYRAVLTGGDKGKNFYLSNTKLFDELLKIDGFKKLGYNLKKVGNISIIVDKNGENTNYIEGQTTKSKDFDDIFLKGLNIIGNKKIRDAQSEQSVTDVMAFAEKIKNSTLSPEAKAMAAILMGSSTYSPLRTLAKVDSVILDENLTKAEEYTWEHAIPADESVRAVLSYILDLPFANRPIITKENLKKFLEESKISLLPTHINDVLNTILKSRMPLSWKPGDDIYNARYFDGKVLNALKANGIDLRGKDLTILNGKGKKIKKINFEARKNALNISNSQEATIKSLKPSKSVKGISVFDFDDTVGLTKGSVLYTMPNDLPIYHGAPKGKDVTKISDKGVKFFATDIREADEYARMNSGTTQQFVINNSQVVDEDVVINKIKELGLTPKNKEFEVDDVSFYELIDTRFEESLSKADITKLFDALKKDNIKAISYNDGAQVSGRFTTSIAVIDTSIISEPKKLNAEEFAKNGSKLLEEGAVFDFSEFSKVVDGKPGPMVEKMKKMIGKFGPENFFILTARPPEAAGPIHEFLSSIGINIPLENITGLGNSTAQAKADWMTAKAAEGYNDFYFADDAPQNVEAVKKALEVPGITSKVQQARIKFSLNSRQDLNWRETGDSKFATFEVKGKEYSLFLTDTGYFNWGDRTEATLNTLINKYDLDEPALLGSYEGETLNLVFSDENSSTDITGGGNAAEVFGTVINGVIDYANANNTDSFIFTAKEPSRIKLYDAIASTIANKLKWNVFSKNGVYIVSKYPAGRGILPFENQSKAVQDVLNVVDVKSPRQQAKIKFSKTMSDDFNRIIEENKGVESYKVFSDITARRRGLKKNRFDFYVPPSAADFELLLYNFMGKGALGEEQKKFFQDALITPYINGVNLMDAVRQSIKKEYKALLKSFPEVKKDLEKLTPNKDFTYDQAMRVAIWSQYGTEIPGLSQRDTIYLTDLINNDPELAAFKDGLIVMGRQKDGWLPPGTFWDSDTIVSDLYNITEGSGRKKFLAEFIENTENIFGKWEDGRLVGPNINKVEAVYGTNVREALEDSIYRMINGKNRSFGQDKETTAWSSWVNGSTGAIMFMNTRSAALQMLGAVNFLNWRDNNPFNAGKAFLNQPQYWKDFARIWNSDKLKERRGGLREDVASAEIANAAAGSKNKVVAVTSYLLKIGYTPTQLADSFAIASGGAPFYRNRINSYLKEGLTEQEAEAKAWQDFSKVSDETQQSGDPKDISKQQSSGAGRLLLVFQNFTMQQSRIVKKAVLDLKNGRGDAKTNIAKIAYYLAVQNIMFSTLQQGLFAVMFDDDEEDEDKKKKKKTDAAIDVANGVLDSILRGTGFVGGVAATLKNTVVKYLEERAKKQKAEYAKVVLEAANMSPPIGSKLRKTYSALQQTKYDKDLIEARGWGVMQDGRVHLGPMYSVTGKLVEVGTNFPMDRLVNKVENVSQAFNSENTAMQRLATGMGYSPWTVGIEGTKGDILIKETAKAKRKEEGWEKSIITRETNKIKVMDSLDKLSPKEYDNYMDKKIEEKIRRRDRRLEILDKLNANK
jgi:hypothetical protein